MKIEWSKDNNGRTWHAVGHGVSVKPYGSGFIVAAAEPVPAVFPTLRDAKAEAERTIAARQAPRGWTEVES